MSLSQQDQGRPLTATWNYQHAIFARKPQEVIVNIETDSRFRRGPQAHFKGVLSVQVGVFANAQQSTAPPPWITGGTVVEVGTWNEEGDCFEFKFENVEIQHGGSWLYGFSMYMAKTPNSLIGTAVSHKGISARPPQAVTGG